MLNAPIKFNRLILMDETTRVCKNYYVPDNGFTTIFFICSIINQPGLSQIFVTGGALLFSLS